MNLEKELFQSTFSKIKISPDLRKELFAMTEKTRKPKKFVARRLLIAAMVLALALALAMGANAATGGELFEATVGKMVSVSRSEDGKTVTWHWDTVTEDGEQAYVTVEMDEDQIPESGGVIATEDGEDVVITAKDGEEVVLSTKDGKEIRYAAFDETVTDDHGTSSAPEA